MFDSLRQWLSGLDNHRDMLNDLEDTIKKGIKGLLKSQGF